MPSQNDIERLKTAILPFDPQAIHRFTQGFGENPQIYGQFGMKGHNGIDFGMGVGTNLLFADPGDVIEVGDQGGKGYGKFVRQLTFLGEQHIYAHLSNISVSKGQRVKRFDTPGKSGNSGFSTGPHLHFGIRPKNFNYGNGYLGYVDPIPRLQIIYKELNTMPDNNDIEGWGVVQNPGGARGFFKGGKLHNFASGPFKSDIEHYLFIRNVKFIPAARYNALPKGTLTAQQVLNGEKDW